jgi:hypothetical protein
MSHSLAAIASYVKGAAAETSAFFSCTVTAIAHRRERGVGAAVGPADKFVEKASFMRHAAKAAAKARKVTKRKGEKEAGGGWATVRSVTTLWHARESAAQARRVHKEMKLLRRSQDIGTIPATCKWSLSLDPVIRSPVKGVRAKVEETAAANTWMTPSTHKIDADPKALEIFVQWVQWIKTELIYHQKSVVNASTTVRAT